MFIVSNRIEVPAESDAAEQFETVFVESMRTTLAGVPGLHRVTLQRPAVSGLPYVSTMEFDCQEDFRAWVTSDSFRASHRNADAPGMRSPSSVEQHVLIEAIDF